MAWCSENEAYSSILDFLHRLGAGSAHEKRVAVVCLDNTQEVTSCFVASSVGYLQMELKRFS